MARVVIVIGLFNLVLSPAVCADDAAQRATATTSGRVHLPASADDAAMKAVPGATRILFVLSAGRITPVGLGELSRLRQLEFLRLNRCSHGDAALKALAEHPTLQHLKMWSDKGVTADGVKQLGSVRKLKSLDFTDVALDEQMLKALPMQIESLKLNRCDIGDAGLAALPTFPRLESLTVQYDDGVTADGLAGFLKRHGNLKSLAVDVTAVPLLKVLGKQNKVKSLWLGSQPVTVEGLEAIAQIKTLERLTISSELGDEIRARIKRLPNPLLKHVVHKGRYIYVDCH